MAVPSWSGWLCDPPSQPADAQVVTTGRDRAHRIRAGGRPAPGARRRLRHPPHEAHRPHQDQRPARAPLKDLDVALSELLGHAQPLEGTESVSTFDADARVLAQDLVLSRYIDDKDERRSEHS